MPGFTVIEGGGNGQEPPNWQNDYARQSFRRLVVEILRGLTGGKGISRGRRITGALNDFLREASQASMPLASIVHDELGDLFDLALRPKFDGTFSDNRKIILLDSLWVIVESLADDPGARGRRSRRDAELMQTIENYVLESEEQARAHGWSYTQKMTARLGPWPPKPKAMTTRKPRRPKAESSSDKGRGRWPART